MWLLFLSSEAAILELYLGMCRYLWLGVCSGIIIIPNTLEALGRQVLSCAFCSVTVFEEHLLID